MTSACTRPRERSTHPSILFANASTRGRRRADPGNHYGIDLRKEALERTRIEQPPGERWHYNNDDPLLLSLVLERTTRQSVSDYGTPGIAARHPRSDEFPRPQRSQPA